MKTTEFAYYLQGYFEITGGTPSIDTNTAKIIDKKLEKLITNQSDSSEILQFTGMLKGLLPILKDPSTASELRQTLSQQVSDQLNSVFIHDIDPSYQGDQQEFNQLHHGKKPGNDFNVRC